MPFPKTWGETRHLVWRYRVTILCTAIVVGGLAAAWVAHLPDQYRASALLVLKIQNFPEAYVRLMSTERAEAQIHVVREVLLSRSLLGRVIDDFRLYGDLRATKTREEIVDAMRRDVTIRLKGNDVFVIAYEGDDAKTVAAVTNHLADLFVGVLRNEVKSDPVRHQAQFLETRLKDLEKQLADLLLVYTPNYPEVIGVRRQIAEVAAQLGDQRRIETGLAPADAPGQPRPDAGAWQEAKILDRAIVPDKPSGPHRVAIALAGFLVGAGLGMTWGLSRSLMDQSFRDAYDVEAVTRIPVLGVVCRLAAPARRRRLLFHVILGLGSGAATAGGVWYLARHFQEVGQWVAQWWRTG